MLLLLVFISAIFDVSLAVVVTVFMLLIVVATVAVSMDLCC